MDNEKVIVPGKWFAEFDHEGNIIRAVHDKSYREILGYDNESIDAFQFWKSNIHPEDKERVFKYLEKSKQSKKSKPHSS